MVEINDHSLIQTVSLVALAVVAFSVGIQKLLKDWKSTNAETSVITLMHTELERMSEQNGLLATELNRLQQEMILLNTQLAQLCIENQQLQTEVVALTEEVNKFRVSATIAAAKKVKVGCNQQKLTIKSIKAVLFKRHFVGNQKQKFMYQFLLLQSQPLA